MRILSNVRRVFAFTVLTAFCATGGFCMPAAQGNKAQLTETLTWSTSGDAHSMDPYGLFEVTTVSFLENIYDPLVRRDINLKLEPALATKWEQTSPKVWTFELRQGVKFHDGSDLKIDDVIFSFNRAKHEDSDFKGHLSNVDKIVKLEPFKFEIHTKTVDPIFTSVLTSLYIMSESWCKKHNAEKPESVKSGKDSYVSRHANGTGPFKLVSRVPDVKTVLEVNENWWDTHKHRIKKGVFRPIQNDATRTAALSSGELDVMYPVPIQDVARIERSPGIKLSKKDGLFVVLVELNQADEELHSGSVKGKNPFKDIRVRKAVYHAIDIQAIHKKIMRGLSKPIGLLYPEGVNGYNPKDNVRLPYDLEKAKSLMKEAGYEKGFAVDFYCPTDRYMNDEKIATALTAMLAKIGIKLNVYAQTKSKFFQDIYALKSDVNLFGWLASTYDAHDALSALAATRKPGAHGEFNQGRYSNLEYDALVVKIRSETNHEKRNQMISEASKILQRDVANVPLHQQALVYGSKNKVEFKIRADNFFQLRNLRFKG